MSGSDDNTGPGHAGTIPFSWRIGALGPALWPSALCLILGLAWVGWLAKNESQNAHRLARAEARARAASLESQFAEGFGAVESLGLLLRQSGGALSNFQRLGTELVSAHPVLAFVELEPGGVVSEVAPAPGHERIVGMNVLKNPAQGPGARAALQHRFLVASGPFTLDHGESGIVARIPLFQPGRDGHEYFRGFVAGWARLSTILTRAGLDTLKTEGYDFAFYAPASGPRGPVRIASQGKFALDDAVDQLVRAQNLEFQLALRPREGWINLRLAGLGLVTVLAASWALYRLLNLLQIALRRADAEKKASRQAELGLAEEKAAHGETLRRAKGDAQRYQAKLNQADINERELHSQLDEALRAATQASQSTQVTSERTQEELQQARQKLHAMQTQLENAAGAERKAVADARVRLEQDRARMAELQSRLDRANQNAESRAASLKALEETNRDLQQRLLAAEQQAAQLQTKLSETIAARTKSGPPAAMPNAATEDNPRAEEAATVIEHPKGPPAKSGKAGKSRRDNQMDLFAGPVQAQAGPGGSQGKAFPEKPVSQAEQAEAEPPKPEPDGKASGQSPSKSKPEKPAPRPLEPAPVNPTHLRKAVNEILPLLMEQDPGARDCLAANRDVFRSALSEDAYSEFERAVKKDDFGAALEQLRRAARKQGVAL